jgi:hypothetical protein
VRWYEIDPTGRPALREAGLIAAKGSFLFNAAISPDRQVNGPTERFGGSFVVGYNASGAATGLDPRVVMASSVNGAALGFRLVRNAVGPYVDFSCFQPAAPDLCRWGDYSGAAPDPRPGTSGRGVVWLTSQYAGSTSVSPATANWRTWIWAARP